jgi:two-component system response regulator MprA
MIAWWTLRTPAFRGPAAAPPGVPSRRVLVVEDDEEQAEWLCRFLESRGIPCEPHADGFSAAASAANERPAAMIVDVALPWLDGPTLCRALRQVVDVPMLLATALPLPLASAEAAAAGGITLLAKPLDLEGLALRLQPHLPPAAAPPRPRSRPIEPDAAQPPG